MAGRANPSPARLLLGVREAADALGISRSCLYTLIGAGTLASVKLGRRRLVPVQELERYVARLAEAAEAAQ